MIEPANSEAMYQALFTLLAATEIGGQPAFVTTSRRLPAAGTAASPAMQPALYMLESEEDITEQAVGLVREEHKVAAIVLFRNPGDMNTVVSTQLNTLRDAVVNQLRSFTLVNGAVFPIGPGQPQTLGGLVYHCRILGKVLKNEGTGNGQGAIVFPISILAGM